MHPAVHEIDLGDFEVVHAGPNPIGGPGFCFGSEDGRLLFTDESGRVTAGPVEAVASHEAVNDVVRHGDYLAVSTRADITLADASADTQSPRPLVLHVGAHGLAVTRSGVFVASAGRLGWVFVEPPRGGGQPVGAQIGWPDTYVYRTVVLDDGSGNDVLACAMRKAGVGAARFEGLGGELSLRQLAYPSFVAADLCGIGGAANPLAVAVAGLDGVLVLYRDVLADRNPQVRRLTAVEGEVYRVMPCQGHLAVLTGQALYLLPDAVTDFLSTASPAHRPRPAVRLPVTAVDACVYDDRYVLIVQDTNVILRLDVGATVGAAGATRLNGAVARADTVPLAPAWVVRDLRSPVPAPLAV